MNKSNKLRYLILASIFAAVTAICSIISIPLPFSPVPVNLALLSVYIAGGLLGPKYGTISQLIYVLLGALGLPVYHSMTGGIGILTGPTGGFLIGYIAAAFILGLIYHGFHHDAQREKFRTSSLILGLFLGLFSCYLLGSLWFIHISGANLASALMLCVIPFLPGDGLKILAAIFLIKKLQPLMNREL